MNAVREVTSEGFSYGKDMEICLVPLSILPLHGRKKKQVNKFIFCHGCTQEQFACCYLSQHLHMQNKTASSLLSTQSTGQDLLY